MDEAIYTYEGYDSGHPWFYLLGGPVLTPKEIREAARASGYGGYLAEDIRQADARPEPQRSTALRSMRAEAQSELIRDVSIYRRVVRELHAYRKGQRDDAPLPSVSAEVHTSMSLKVCHLYNDFAHLLSLDDLLTRQRDLFDF